MKNLKKYTIKKSIIGSIVVVFNCNKDLVEEIILSTPNDTSQDIAKRKYGALEETPKNNVIEELENYLSARPFKFSLDYLDLDQCSDFQKSVLIAEFNSKYGTTNTYGDLAKKINNEKASRAVGNALANNPFPIIIPCHRTIRKDKKIGNFGGGTESKRILINLEKNNN